MRFRPGARPPSPRVGSTYAYNRPRALMAQSWDDLPPRRALAEIARDFHARGWMPGTAGNLSALDAHAADARAAFWITASGKPKGRLDEDDFLLVDIDCGEVQERREARAKPSAETAIHRAIYRLFSSARACLHVHTIDACIAGERCRAEATALALPPLEIVKGFDIWEQSPRVALPLFPNLLAVARIADEIEARFRAEPPPLTALLIRGHGTTVWGASLQQAYDRVECLEFLLSASVRL